MDPLELAKSTGRRQLFWATSCTLKHDRANTDRDEGLSDDGNQGLPCSGDAGTSKNDETAIAVAVVAVRSRHGYRARPLPPAAYPMLIHRQPQIVERSMGNLILLWHNTLRARPGTGKNLLRTHRYCVILNSNGGTCGSLSSLIDYVFRNRTFQSVDLSFCLDENLSVLV